MRYSGSNRPVLDLQFGHREVFGVAGGKRYAQRDGDGGDEAVSLSQGNAASRVLTAPVAGACTFCTTD